MKIAGFKKQSFIDFPGRISSVVFTQGCNLRCPYCHNSELVLPKLFTHTFKLEFVLGYIKQHALLLDAVCITGGEPCLQKGLVQFIIEVKKLGLAVKLDTNGTNPKMLNFLLATKLIDFVAMDVKHLLDVELYNLAVGNVLENRVFTNILRSISLIQSSDIEHVFRTTIVHGIHTKDQVKTLCNQFMENYKIQNFNNSKIMQKQHSFKPFSQEEMTEFNTFVKK